MKKLALFSITATAAMIIGCGGSSDNGTTNDINGNLIDSPIEGVIYKSKSYNSTTGANGSYVCKENEIVSFYAGEIKLGDVICNRLTTPLSLGHGDKTIATNIAYFIQNLDTDGNISDDITLPTDIPALAVDFTDQTSVEDTLKGLGKTIKISPTQAYQNFKNYMADINEDPNLLLEPIDKNLTDEQKYALAYMWNDEKMANNLYLALNKSTPNQTLYNIATNAETRHESMVENLAKVYDVNITNLKNYGTHFDETALEKYSSGKFFIPKVQETYNALYEKGSQSLTDALQVGCMVEVTDIDDLDKYLEIVKDKPDIVNVFESLRNGSYNHYWAFDEALKNLGISDGCCSAGEEYCKTSEEYPTNNLNAGNGMGYGQENGQGYRGGRK